MMHNGPSYGSRRCHVKMGTPQIGDHGSLFLQYFGDPWVPIFTGNWGPSHENGDPSAKQF